MDTSKPTAISSEASSPLDVLIIDGETSTAEACRQALEEDGYRVAVAGSGPQGLQMAESNSPSVVLLDLRIPGVTGFEALGRLAKTGSATVPIVMTGD